MVNQSELIKEYQEAQRLLRIAQSAFEYSEPEFIECSIAQLAAAEERVSVLLRLIRYGNVEISYS
jgi:hypothetical protein